MIQTKSVLKEYFETGDKPTQQQYENLIDSLRHAYDKIPLDDLEEDVVSQSEFQSHLDNAIFSGNVNIQGTDSQLTILDNNQSNVDIGDTQSSILLKGMYATGSVDNIYSQARLRLVKDQADGTAGSAFAIDVMNNAGGLSTLTERLVIDSEGDFNFKNGSGTFGEVLTVNTSIGNSNLFGHHLRLGRDSNNFISAGTTGGSLHFVVNGNILSSPSYVIDNSGNHDFQSGTADFAGLITGTGGMTLGSTASTTTRNPQYLVFGGSAGSEYGMELGYDSVREKYSTRIITSSSQDIAFGAMNAPATDHSDFTEYMVIKNGGDFDFKSGAATFGGNVDIAGILDITKNDNSLSGITITNSNVGSGAAATLRLISDGGSGYIYKTSNAFGLGLADRLGIQNAEGIQFVTGSTLIRYEIDSSGNHDFKSGAATFGGTITVSSDNNILADFTSTDSIGEIRIGDNIAYTRLLTGGVDFKIMPNNGTEVAVFEGDTLKTLLKGALDVTTTGTFGGNVTAPNFLGDLISDQITAGTTNGSVQIRNNAGQPIATFSDALNTAFTGNISLESDKFLYLGNSNNARLFANSTNTFFDGLTGNMYFRNQFDGGNIYFQVENLSGDDLDLIEIHGDTEDVLLRHGSSSKLQTTAEGINVYGELSVIKSGGASPHEDTDLLVADSTAALSTAQLQILGGNAGSSSLFFSDTDSYASGGIKYTHTNDSMTFRVDNHDLIELSDSKLFLGKNSTSGQVRIDYRKDSNNSNGWYTGYFSSSNINNSFGVYGYESDGDYRVYTNNTLALTIDTSQDASFNAGITATGTITVTSADPKLELFETGYTDNNFDLYLNSGGLKIRKFDDTRTNYSDVATFVGGTLELSNDGNSGYTHSRIILNSGGNARGAGTFSYGQENSWFWGNPYLNHESHFVIARSNTASDAVADLSNALFTLTEDGIKIPTSIEISRTGWNTYSIQQSAGNGLQFYDLTANNSTMYLIDDKVGINNTAPTKALDVTGEVKATNFIGDWNGKATSDVVSTTGDVAEDITGAKVFTDGLTIGFYGPTDEKAYLSAKNTDSSVTTNLLEYGASGILKVLEPTKFNQGLEANDYKLNGLNTAPTSAIDTGATGEIRYTADYIYVCVAPNSWKRTALAIW